MTITQLILLAPTSAFFPRILYVGVLYVANSRTAVIIRLHGVTIYIYIII